MAAFHKFHPPPSEVSATQHNSVATRPPTTHFATWNKTALWYRVLCPTALRRPFFLPPSRCAFWHGTLRHATSSSARHEQHTSAFLRVVQWHAEERGREGGRGPPRALHAPPSQTPAVRNIDCTAASPSLARLESALTRSCCCSHCGNGGVCHGLQRALLNPALPPSL